MKKKSCIFFVFIICNIHSPSAIVSRFRKSAAFRFFRPLSDLAETESRGKDETSSRETSTLANSIVRSFDRSIVRSSGRASRIVRFRLSVCIRARCIDRRVSIVSRAVVATIVALLRAPPPPPLPSRFLRRVTTYTLTASCVSTFARRVRTRR